MLTPLLHRHSEVVEAAHRDLQHQYRLVDLELNKTLKRCGLLEEQLRAKSPESLSASGIGKPVKAKAGTVPPFALAGRSSVPSIFASTIPWHWESRERGRERERIHDPMYPAM